MTKCIKQQYKLKESYGYRGYSYLLMKQYKQALSDFTYSLKLDNSNSTI